MELHKLRLEDKAWMDSIVMAEDTQSADFCFGGLVVWNDISRIMTGKLGERLIVCSDLNGRLFFGSPIGSGPIAPAVFAIKEACDREGIPMLIYGVTERNREQMEREMPGKLRFEEKTDYEDYVYEIDRLAELSGRKLHSKKNHVNKFLSLYPDWKYERMRPAHFDSCRKLLAGWQAAHRGDDEEQIQGENSAIERAFRYFDVLDLEGGVLYADGTLCAFTIGEKCAGDAFVVHFEKADRNVEGAYTMINREFVRQIRDGHPEIRYINREDDMGLESLRKAKRSYHPCFMVKKYSAFWAEG